MSPPAVSHPAVSSRLALLRQALADPNGLAPADAPALLSMGLGGAVLASLRAGHPLAPLLSPQRLALLARHLRIRAAFEQLLGAWHGAGVKVVLLKGFALAEFVYPDPSQRLYGDVDVLIKPQCAAEAARLSCALGWRSDGLADVPAAWTHEVAHLYSPDGQTRLDVHQSVTARSWGTRRKVERATRRVWQSAQPARLGQVPVWLPDPRDQVLMVALTRAWSGDGAWLKPADPFDLRVLRAHHHLTENALLERGAALGCQHTYRTFAQSCAEVALDDARAARRVRLARWLDGYLGADTWLARLGRAPGVLAETCRVLPAALAVRRALAKRGDPRKLPERWTLCTPHSPALVAVPAALRGVNWALRLLYPAGATCVPRALTRYAVLAAAGVPVSFVSGVRSTETGVEGHAWIELGEHLDAEYGEPEARRIYATVFRHDARPG